MLLSIVRRRSLLPASAMFTRSLSMSTRRFRDKNKFCAIIGSGPAGFFTAQGLFESDKTNQTHIDVFDKETVPGGLVRYGVAPDHPRVKNVIQHFSSIAGHKNFRFFGNVEMGADFTMATLRKAYDAIVLCYGAGAEKKLNIPGENAKEVHGSGNFVGWYNGHQNWVKPDLSRSPTAIVIGHGNVAVDIARFLLSSPGDLEKTGISKEAIAALQSSRIKDVHLVGMGGPLQATFTLEELREFFKLRNVRVQFNPNHFEGIRERFHQIPADKRPTIEEMLNHLDKQQTQEPVSFDWKVLNFDFFRAAREIVCDPINKSVTGVRFSPTVLENPDDLSTESKLTVLDDAPITTIETGLVVKSIGYRGICADPMLPFDETTGRIVNTAGRVKGLPGVYCAGWISCGAVGLIADMFQNAMQVAKIINNDFSNKMLEQKENQAETRNNLVMKLEQKYFTGCQRMNDVERKFANLLLNKTTKASMSMETERNFAEK